MKVRSSDDALAIIDKLNTKIDVIKEATPVTDEQLKQIEKLCKEAGSGVDWYANTIMGLDTAAQAQIVIDDLEKKLRQQPEERVWK